MDIQKFSDRFQFDHDTPFHEEVQSLKSELVSTKSHMDLILRTMGQAVDLKLDRKGVLVDRLKKSWAEFPMNCHR